MNPALCRDQKESREKVSLQYKDEEKKKDVMTVSLISLSLSTHILTLSHTLLLILAHKPTDMSDQE